ncbi:MFS transporter [Hymenobacter koreensis]|uniref:MFS transporter n=2 Tax=Hymenobacter koreensis TaxID=1084523 RepID=A0ABP8IWN4_9BACT
MCFASWASRIPDISLKLGLSEGELGQLLLAVPVGSLLALPPAGWLVHRWGSRQVLLLAAGLYSVALPLLGLADRFWRLAPALALFGLASNLVNIAVNTQAIGVQAHHDRPIMGSFHGLWSLAGFLSGAFATLLISWHLSPLPHFLIIMTVGLAIIGVAHRYTLRHDEGREAGGLAWRRPDPYLLRIGLIAFCGMLCEGTMFDWAGVYFQRVVRPGPALVTSGYVACMGTMALGRFAADALTHRFGATRVLQLSSALISVGLLLAVALPYLLPALLGFGLVGFGIAAVVPLSYSAAGQAGSMAPGPALALVSSISFTGFLLGPPLIGFLAEASSLRVSLAFVALVGAGIGLLAARSRPRKAYLTVPQKLAG